MGEGAAVDTGVGVAQATVQMMMSISDTAPASVGLTMHRGPGPDIMNSVERTEAERDARCDGENGKERVNGERLVVVCGCVGCSRPC